MHRCPHEVHNPERHTSHRFWTWRFVAGYKSLQISKSVPQVTLNNITQQRCPAARQGLIYKPTRSKLNPKCSYNSTGAVWWAYHPMLLLVGFQRINRPGNHITGRWLSSLGECTRRMMWGRSDCDTGQRAPPSSCLGCGVCHWTATEKTRRGPDHGQPLNYEHSKHRVSLRLSHPFSLWTEKVVSYMGLKNSRGRAMRCAQKTATLLHNNGGRSAQNILGNSNTIKWNKRMISV